MLQSLSVFILLVFCLILKKLWQHRHSPLRKVAGPQAKSFVTGVFPQLFDRNGWAFHRRIAETYGGVIRIDALLGERQLFIFDPQALRSILVKDQAYYEEAPPFINTNLLVFGPGLFSTLGEQHHKQRKMLKPLFSPAQLQALLPTFFDVAHRVRDALIRRAQQPSEIDILSWMGRTALETMSISGLGHSFDPLTEDEHAHPYCISTKRLGATMFKLLFARTYVLPLVRNLGTPRFRRFLIGLIPWKALRDMRDISDIITQTSVELYEKKLLMLEKGVDLEGQNGGGYDILTTLIQANHKASAHEALTKEEVLGQISSLTFASMDTTSVALSRALHELALHPDVQANLRMELRRAREQHGEINPNELLALPYLDAVVRETLRLHPPASFVLRTARKDMVLPLSKPIPDADGIPVTEIVVPNGTSIICGLQASNCNTDLWGKDAHEWKPERWLHPLPQSLTDAGVPAIYSHIMTFLGGNRGCIGMKFAEMEIKIVLSSLVEVLDFSLSDKEIFWQLGSIISPTVVGSQQPQLPLRVQLASSP